MTKDVKVTITKTEYADLLLAAEILQRLEVGGVDNWSYYGESLNPEGEPDLDDLEELIKDQVWGSPK